MAARQMNSREPVRRRYTSAKRNEAARATRRNIRASGERLFLQDGYAATTMAAVAHDAGVAERTVYLAFPSKAELLTEIIRVGVRGDDQLTALRDREDVRHTEQAQDAEELLGRFARASAAVMARAARFIGLAEAAATGDPALSAIRDRAHEAIRTDMRRVASALAELHALRRDVDPELATDILFAIAGNDSVYRRLTGECGHADHVYAEMIERALRGALLRERG